MSTEAFGKGTAPFLSMASIFVPLFGINLSAKST